MTKTRGRPRKTKERELVLQLVAQGLTIFEAGKVCGVTKASVSQWKCKNSDFRQRLLTALVQSKQARTENRQKSQEYLQSLSKLLFQQTAS